MSFRPKVFGKYYLVDKIATGGMAEIFKAKTYSHGGFENLLVIKRILPHIGDNEDFVEMFIDEAKVSVALQHANIVRIYDFGKILDNYFIAMECVEGKDVRNLLRQLARTRKYLPVEFAAYIAHETLRGLHYAHTKTNLNGRPYEIVHRDISPSNVLISYEGVVKVADFGIAKAESNVSQTQEGMLKGKYEYMSPEQAGGFTLDARSDVFSLGIILHEMLTGRRLFKAGSDIGALKKIRNEDVMPPSELSPRVPGALDQIVLKALTKDRDQRYASAAAMADDLHAFLVPKSPDEIRVDLQRFCAELFADEIADERKRLERGSELAKRMRSQGPSNSWDDGTDSTMTASHPTSSTTQVGQALPWMMAGGVAMVIPLVAVLLVAIVLGVKLMQPAPATSVVEAPAPTASGSLVVSASPAARIYIDDTLRTEGERLELAELSPGKHTLRIVAQGYVTVEETIQIDPGQAAEFQRKLVRVAPAPTKARPTKPKPKPKPKPQPTANTGTLRVTLPASVPWAHVYVDGAKQRKTAPNNYKLAPGSHQVRVENPPAGLSFSHSITVGAGKKTTLAAIK